MNPRLPRHHRHAGAGLQRRRDHLLLLRRAPAPSSLNRGDDLDTSIRHVTIPVNSHMTHTLSRSTRRPLTEGYQYLRWWQDLLILPQSHANDIPVTVVGTRSTYALSSSRMACPH